MCFIGEFLKVTLFVHSLGGYFALSFAERYSDRLQGFALVHSTAFPDSEDVKKGREASIEKIKKQGISALIDGLVPKLFAPEHMEERETDVEAAELIGYQTSPEGAIAALKAMKNRPDRNHVLSATALPIRLVAGEHDQIISAEKTFSVSKEKSTQSLLKDVGHLSMMESPDQLTDVIRQFARFA